MMDERAHERDGPQPAISRHVPHSRQCGSVPLPTTTAATVSRLLAVAGELDSATASMLRRSVDLLIDQGTQLLQLDTSELGHCGAAGLNLFVDYRARLGASGGSLTIVNPTKLLVRLLQITNLEDLLSEPTDRGQATPQTVRLTHSAP